MREILGVMRRRPPVTLAKGQKVASATTWSGGANKVPLQAQFLKPGAHLRQQP
ncbi:MAG: hypothetical protein R3E56_02785 [Burkholderiaceae bacterium]